MSPFRKFLLPFALLLAAIAIVLIFLAAWPLAQEAPASPAPSAVQSNPNTLPPPAAPTPQQLEELQQNPTPNYLISYTDKGFAPMSLTLNPGQTVRFTNNSSQ